MQARQPEYEEGYDYYSRRPSDLQKLGDLDNWEIEEGDPDIRGWSVVDMSEDQIGTVDDLLISTEAEQAVFAIVSHGGGFLGMGGEKTLMPLDRLDFDTENERVRFHGDADDIKNAPKYTDDTRDYMPFYDYWSGRMGAMREGEIAAGERRVIPEVEEHLEVGKRMEQVGEVEIHKEVETRPETVRETLMRTKVHVYRREIEPGREIKPGEQVLREGETIRIPVVEEKLVVEKKPEVTGEVIIQPEMVEEEEEITRQVREEHVEVKATGDAEIEEEEEEERAYRR